MNEIVFMAKDISDILDWKADLNYNGLLTCHASTSEVLKYFTLNLANRVPD